jgi:ribosomal protein S18 acetylase RimI-like enzyme
MASRRSMDIRTYRPGDEGAVVSLWQECGLTRPWNDPRKDIARKLLVQPELFLVGTLDGRLIATVMAGYDGHRGWVNYLAVAPRERNRGLGRALMARVEQLLLAMGCPKVNIQVRASNSDVLAFYRALGYAQEEVIGLGKRLIPDQAPDGSQ